MEIFSLTQYVFGALSGSIVGFSLGLIGGGGSILAIPLMIYIVGMRNAHLAIGTSALAVAINAYLALIPHARAGNVRWRTALWFTVAGALGAWLGSSLGKMVNGERLLFVFAILMLVVAGLMLLRQDPGNGVAVSSRRPNLVRVWSIGVGVGGVSGFFGIGGGFLIVPGLIAASDMSMLNAVGSSLLAVGTFGLTTAVNYARSGLVDWPVAGVFVLGGFAGGWFGEKLAYRLGQRKKMLTYVFSAVVAVVAVYMLYTSA